MDNAIEKFSLAQPSWVMSDKLEQVKPKVFLYIPFVLTNLSWEDLPMFWGVFDKTIIPLVLVGHAMIIAMWT